MPVICSGTLPDSTRLTKTVKVPKSRFPVSPTDLPTSCLRWPGRRPSGPAADPGLKELIALLVSVLEPVLGWIRHELDENKVRAQYTDKSQEFAVQQINFWEAYLPKTQELTYLGSIITSECSLEKEMLCRI